VHSLFLWNKKSEKTKEQGVKVKGKMTNMLSEKISRSVIFAVLPFR
jgi:hypothetical protein